MHHQTADEFFVGKGNVFCSAIFIVFCSKGNGAFVYLYNPGVCNGNAVCITPEIFNGIPESVKGFLDVRNLCFPIKGIAEFSPLVRVL